MEGVSVTIDEVLRLRSSVILDVRPLAERHGGIGFIPGSLGCPVAILLDEAHRWKRLSVSGPIILTCLTGRRSDDAVTLMHDAGIGTAMSLKGGVLAWKATGRPVCGAAETHPCDVPEVTDAESFIVAIKSCFVAEWAEHSNADDDFNPVDFIRRTFERVPRTRTGLLEAVDEISSIAWHRGHPLTAIAANVDRMLAAIAGLSDLPEIEE